MLISQFDVISSNTVVLIIPPSNTKTTTRRSFLIKIEEGESIVVPVASIP